MRRRDIVYLSIMLLTLFTNNLMGTQHHVFIMIGMIAGILFISSMEDKITKFGEWMKSEVTFKKTPKP